MIKFGTGGWRAVIGDEFTKANVKLLVQGLCDIFEKDSLKKETVIGFDRRFLSDFAAKWAAEVFAANGVKVRFIGRDAPTPMIMFAARQADVPYALAVTASHNPAEYNGIKVFTAGGRDAAKDVTDKIEAAIEAVKEVKSVDFEAGRREGLIVDENISNEYIDSILAQIDVEAIKRKNLRVLLDPMFGVSKTSLQTVLSIARCEVGVINDRHDTLFGGKLPSPTAKTLDKLKAMVVDEGYDIGIATDGDADRLGIIDEHGNYIHPNRVLELLYYYFLKYKGLRGDCVRNIATTCVLDRIAADFGCRCIEVPVGFKYISAGMDEYDAILGGESSGGLTIKGHIKGKDGILAASVLVEMICVSGKRLSELLDEIDERYGKTFVIEDDMRFAAEKREEMMKVLFTDKALPDFGAPVKSVDYRDGVKVWFEDGGWIIIRFSGTEPLLRIYCETGSPEESERINAAAKAFCGSI